MQHFVLACGQALGGAAAACTALLMQADDPDDNATTELQTALTGLSMLCEPQPTPAFSAAVCTVLDQLPSDRFDIAGIATVLDLLATPAAAEFLRLAAGEFLLQDRPDSGALLDSFRHEVRAPLLARGATPPAWPLVLPLLRRFFTLLARQPVVQVHLPSAAARALLGRSRVRNVAAQQQVVAAVGGTISHVQQTVVQGDLYTLPGLRDPDLRALYNRYRAFLLDTFSTLDVRGILQIRHVGRVALGDVYVPLTALYHGTAALFGARAADASAPGGAVARLHDCVRDLPLLVVLGDPGSGKSTLVRYLLLVLAAGEARERVGLDPTWLPIFFPVAAFGEARSQPGQADLAPFDYLRTYYAGLSQPDYVPLFQRALAQGRGLVLFDGLDEVRGDRRDLVRCIEAFVREWDGPGNRFVATSRVAGYDQAPLDDTLFARVVIQPFTDDDIHCFIDRWSRAYEGALSPMLGAGVSPRALAAAAVDLERRVAQHRESLSGAVFADPGITDLARKPLLLTILALIHNQGARLPDRRVDLYRLCVEALAETWNRTRSLSGRAINLYLGDEKIDERLVVNLLGPAALWIHAQRPGGDVDQADLEQQITSTLIQIDGLAPGQARKLAAGFIELMRSDTGLIQERAYRRFGFIHQTFEEYLAARGLLESVTINDPDALIHTYCTEPRWREVLRLAVAASTQREAQRLLLHLLNAPTTAATRGRPVVLAGECLLDIGRNGATRRAWRAVGRALLLLLRDREVPLATRVAGGHILGRLGDPRGLDPAAGPRQVTAYWCPIAAGTFWSGLPADARPRRNGRGRGDELSPLELTAGFQLARYPVTNAEYERFVAAGGYGDRRWWTPTGWVFLQGTAGGVPGVPASPLSRPGLWHAPQFNSPAQPVVGVSWYEAAAYCAWLTAVGHAAGWLAADETLRLPTALEWERAARHTDRRRYPWGDEPPDPERANYDATGLRVPAPVGCFPGGAAECGALDLAGNVWEWTGTRRAEPCALQACADLPPGDAAVIRGGAFNWEADYLACSAYYWFNPGYRYNLLGFRLVRVRDE